MQNITLKNLESRANQKNENVKMLKRLSKVKSNYEKGPFSIFISNYVFILIGEV